MASHCFWTTGKVFFEDKALDHNQGSLIQEESFSRLYLLSQQMGRLLEFGDFCTPSWLVERVCLPPNKGRSQVHARSVGRSI